MSRRYSTRLFRKVLVPVIYGAVPDAAVTVAMTIADSQHVMFAGIVGIPDGESLSAAAIPARAVRQTLRELGSAGDVRISGHIRVGHQPWNELTHIVEQEKPDLLILDTAQLGLLNMTAGEALRYPPCDMIIASGFFPERPRRVLCALRGGPYAELALRLGLAIGRTSQAQLTALHLSPLKTAPLGAPAFKGVDRVLRNLPQVDRKYVKTDDAASG